MPDQPGPYDTPRPPKSYLGEAILTLALYYFGIGLGGFIANFYFMRQLREDHEAGIPTKFGGCLTALLIAHIVLLAVVVDLIAANFLSRPGG
jgi:hypothetical protein